VSLPFGVISAQFATVFVYEKMNNDTVEICHINFSEQTEKTMLLLENAFTVELPAVCLIIYFILWIVSKIIKVKTLRGFVYDKILIVMCVLSLTVWSAMLNVSMLIDLSFEILFFVMYVIHGFVGFSIVVKPILLAWLHEGFRRELQKLVGFNSSSPERTQFF
jgi:hypothetical protein